MFSLKGHIKPPLNNVCFQVFFLRRNGFSLHFYYLACMFFNQFICLILLHIFKRAFLGYITVNGFQKQRFLNLCTKTKILNSLIETGKKRCIRVFLFRPLKMGRNFVFECFSFF